jgi:hypothetical protein
MAQAAVSGNEGQGQRQPPQEPEILVVEDGDESGQQQTANAGQQPAGQGYEYPDDDNDESQGGGDSRVGQVSGGGETAQQANEGQQQVSQQELSARQRRRQRERNARLAERSELIKLRQQVGELQARLDQTDSRIGHSEAAGLDGQIQNLESEVQRATTVMSRAMVAQNAEDYAQALTIRDALRDRLISLKQQKASFEQGGRVQDRGNQVEQGGQGQTQQGANLTPNQIQFARIFASRHPWYKHGSDDQDSQMVVQIDNEMTAQGLNPNTPEYWMELEHRIREDMPHKFQQQAAPNNEGGQNTGNGQGQQKVNNGNGQNGAGSARRAGGPKLPGSGNAGGGAGGNGPVKFHLSPARKQALIDLGVWDDPEQRMKHIKSFIQWDKDHGGK